MKKILLPLLLVMLSVGLLVPAALAADNDPAQTPKQLSELTESQKSELEALFRQLLEIRKQIIDKLSSFGVIDSKRAEYLKERMDLDWKYRDLTDGWMPGLGFRVRGWCPMWGDDGQSTRAGKFLPRR